MPVVGLAPIAVPPPKLVIPRGAPVLNLRAVVARPLEVPGGRRPWLVLIAACQINKSRHPLGGIPFYDVTPIWKGVKYICLITIKSDANGRVGQKCQNLRVYGRPLYIRYKKYISG